MSAPCGSELKKKERTKDLVPQTSWINLQGTERVVVLFISM